MVPGLLFHRLFGSSPPFCARLRSYHCCILGNPICLFMDFLLIGFFVDSSNDFVARSGNSLGVICESWQRMMDRIWEHPCLQVAPSVPTCSQGEHVCRHPRDRP